MYRIVLDEETEAQIEALPYEALAPFAELLDGQQRVDLIRVVWVG